MFKNALKIFLGLALVSSASATTLLFQLIIGGTGSLTAPGGSFDQPMFRLSNQSTVAATITNFRVTLGDTSYNFDRGFVNAHTMGGGSSRTLVSPGDNLNDASRANLLEYNFTGFDAVLAGGPALDERVDIGGELDRDMPPAATTNNTVDFRTVFFNNGAAANAVIRVQFLQGGVTTTQTITMADQTPGQAQYTFATPIPEPGTLAIFSLGVGAILIARFRRRS